MFSTARFSTQVALSLGTHTRNESLTLGLWLQPAQMKTLLSEIGLIERDDFVPKGKAA